VKCLDDAQCAGSEFCVAGGCVPDLCTAGSGFCQNDAVVACSARGDLWNPPAPCSARQACVESAGGAVCEDWVCTPGQTECSGPRTVVTCAADGLGVVSSVDCSQTNQYCSAGACSDQVCTPNTDFCDQGAVRHCAADGLSSSSVTTCTVDQYCEGVSGTCKATVCTKGQPACDGNRETRCNADGSGFLAGGTNCTNQSRTCVAGVCQQCPAGGTASAVRLVEVFTGQADYVRVKNTSANCPAELSDLTLSVQDTDSSTITNLTIGALTLAPGAEALVSESGTTGDVLASGLIDLNATAGYVLLCLGPCSTSGTPTVLDALSYWNGTTAAPALPAPVTFTSIQGIAADPTGTAFVRNAFTGSYPAFHASDWSVGPATRPEASTPCPGTQPATLSICTTIGQICTYGAVTCTCSLYWVCG